MSTIGLVLSGGGARGAYQVGVISAIAEVARQHNIKSEIKIFSGNSAGSLNAAFLAGSCENFYDAAKQLVDIWSHLKSDNIFLSDIASLGKIGLKWVEELSFGAITGTTPGKALLDTSPLKSLIDKHLRSEKIKDNIKKGHLHALAVSALDYSATETVTFVQGRPDLKMWNKARRHSESTMINPDHILASSSIPILFPPIKVDNKYYGDGCIRNMSPISPAIYLGASKVFIIGVRAEHQDGMIISDEIKNAPPSVAKILNILLNAIMLDGIEQDVERLERVNEFVSKVNHEPSSKLVYKPIKYCFISPSVDAGLIARDKSSRLPRMIRYLLKGLGSLEDASEIISYLLFDPDFCTQLIEIGFEDGMRQRDEILALLTEN